MLTSFRVNAYFFLLKCLLLFAKSPALQSRKPGSPAPKAFVWLSSSLRTLETDKGSVIKNGCLLSFCTVIWQMDDIRLIAQSEQSALSSGTEIS